MKKTVATLAATLVLGAGGLAGAPQAFADPGEPVGHFETEAQCVSAGDAGVADGNWSSYRCIHFEFDWELYVS